MKLESVPEALSRLDGWVNSLANMLPRPVRADVITGGFVWRFEKEGLEVLLLAKVVRISSALGAAWELANLGYTTESSALLRLVDDFAEEIRFMAEARIEGRETKAQTDFREQFFREPPRTPDEFLEQENKHYVSRREMKKASKRLAEKAGQDGGLLDRTSSFISYGLNQYIHGTYGSAMDLYHGRLHRFMVRGLDGQPKTNTLAFVGSKATGVLHAVELVAILYGASVVATEIRSFLMEADPDLPRS
ncbi:MAG: hypothetical protein WEA09_05305 [Gemmatimonadota bacterium]